MLRHRAEGAPCWGCGCGWGQQLRPTPPSPSRDALTPLGTRGLGRREEGEAKSGGWQPQTDPQRLMAHHPTPTPLLYTNTHCTHMDTHTIHTLPCSSLSAELTAADSVYALSPTSNQPPLLSHDGVSGEEEKKEKSERRRKEWERTEGKKRWKG